MSGHEKPPSTGKILALFAQAKTEKQPREAPERNFRGFFLFPPGGLHKGARRWETLRGADADEGEF